MDSRPNSLVCSVTDAAGYALAGALFGALIVGAVDRYTPLKPPWWVGLAVGSAVGASAQWHKENMP